MASLVDRDVVNYCKTISAEAAKCLLCILRFRYRQNRFVPKEISAIIARHVYDSWRQPQDWKRLITIRRLKQEEFAEQIEASMIEKSLLDYREKVGNVHPSVVWDQEKRLADIRKRTMQRAFKIADIRANIED